MENRRCIGPEETKNLDSQSLRDHYLVENLMQEGKVTSVYSHYDRVVVGGAVPAGKELKLEADDALKSDYFLERREIGIMLIAGKGAVRVEGEEYPIELKECLYIGKGVKEVVFLDKGSETGAQYYFVSTPAHVAYPTHKMTTQEAEPQPMGASEQSNERVIYKYIHPDGIKSCQLMMGFTEMQTGSIWNTMPPHLHERRMEVYFYFDLADDQRVWHFMGEPHETRHLLVSNKQAVISPPWSIHSGAGTANYTFIWAMAGENQSFADMDWVKMDTIR